ncbi:hypothetical protein [Marinibacterium profundimaris]|uniref:hypothetical protein n=1 Tax=Marinibacterium profundimaris TaxID=1679460 RepID=UPI00117C2422|nr:hypothetical protein [Marinibacterium profundimaris]
MMSDSQGNEISQGRAVMAGGTRRWSAQLNDQSKQSALRHAGERGAVGLLNAREDVRQKLIEEGWFGRSADGQGATYQGMSPETEQGHGIHGPADEVQAGTVSGQNEGHTQDFYGSPNWQSVKEASHSEAGADRVGHTAEQQKAWEMKQAQAHEVYGQGREEPEPEM